MSDTYKLCNDIVLSVVDKVSYLKNITGITTDIDSGTNISMGTSLNASASISASTQTEIDNVSDIKTTSMEMSGTPGTSPYSDNSNHNDSTDRQPECYICAYPINMQSLCYRKRPLKLPCDCKNVAHADCLLRWIVKKGKCPTCRYDFLSTGVSMPGRVNQSGNVLRRHSEFRASFGTLRNSHALWRRILQIVVITFIAVLRLYVLFLVFGKLSIVILLGLILLYYIKKCYDRRRIMPLNVVFSLPVF